MDDQKLEPDLNAADPEAPKSQEEAEDTAPGDLYGFQPKNYNDTNKRPQSITLKLIMDRNLNKTVTYEESKLKMLNRLQVISSASSSPRLRTPSNRLPSLRPSREPTTVARDPLMSIEDSVSLDTGGGAQPTASSLISEKAKSLLKLTHIHLDREAITEIDNLAEYLGNVTNLYLHHNLIKRIENLDYLKSLKFLILSHNQIKRVENLKNLINLKLLDLSNNSIDQIDDVAEFPTSIMFLDLRDNPVVRSALWMSEDYQAKLEIHLTGLRQLNGEDLSGEGDEETNSVPSELDQSVQDDVSQTAKMILPKRDYYLSRPEISMESITDEILNRSRQRQKSFLVDSERTLRERKSILDNVAKTLQEKLDEDSAKDSSVNLKIKNILYSQK